MGDIEIENLRKEFQDGDKEITAVDGINLNIESGEFVVLVGPSGCGKSTTLRCIAGLENVTDGKILVNGEDNTNYEPKERDMAMVFQNYALYPHMTARENMAFGLKMGSTLSSEEIEKRVEEVAEMSDITELLDKKPGDLSGGQQQRVALGRAIVRDPEVFLMDEPLSNLDAKLRAHMRTEIQDLQKELGVTTIYVTHDQTEAMTMGDRVAILKNGKIQQFDPPVECYNNPTNKFVASFIGSPSMNFMDVEYKNGKIQNGLFEYEISNNIRSMLVDSDEYILGVRPEDIIHGGGDDPNQIKAPIKVIEPTGDIAYVHVNINDKEWTLNFDTPSSIQSNEEIDFSFREEDIYLFDKETGNTIKSKSDVISVETNTV